MLRIVVGGAGDRGWFVTQTSHKGEAGLGPNQLGSIHAIKKAAPAMA